MIRLKNKSLRFRLIVVISLTALFIWSVSTLVAWLQVRKEVNHVFDAQQILFAERLASSNLHTFVPERHLSKEHRKKPFHKAGYDDDALAFAVFSLQGERVLHDGNNGEYFPFNPTPHRFSVTAILNDEDPWRIFWLPVAGGRLFIAVGQEIDYRDDLTNQMVLSQMWIWFAGLPLLLGLIVWIINRELKTLRQVGEAVQQRSPDLSEPLSTAVPQEILPLVENLNHFFARTSTQLLRERRFTSDAAHELRSPLAALKIQTELAQMADDDVAMRERALHNLTQGIDRATQLIDQLLTLSRLDNLKQLEGVELVDWEKIIHSLIGELYFQAQKQQIDLQFEPLAHPQTEGQPLLLSMMLRNLIENAIKYAQQGSTVRIRLSQNTIIVADNGGGVDESDIAKLGQRFYRPAGQNEKGSGLGLSIVHRIAELHHYRVQLTNQALDGKIGLQATIFI